MTVDNQARGIAAAAFLEGADLHSEVEQVKSDVDAMKSIGRYLSVWDCTTGLPQTEPTTIPYAYQAGDYYRIGVVADAGGTNYKPTGTIYTGEASTVVESGDPALGGIYIYDSTSWGLLKGAVLLDAVPIEGSTNAVTSGGVFTALETVAEELVRANAEMVGASSTADGQAGKVPAPTSEDREKFLCGDGSWATPQTGGGGDIAGVVAPAYSQSETYNEGDLVIYESLLYRAKQDISTPEAWTEAHWGQTTVDVALKQYMKYSTLVITCLTQDGVTVTGQTVTVRKGSDASGPVYAQATYNGQPVSILVPVGFDYFVSVSDTLEHHFNPTVTYGVVSTPTINVTLMYSDFSNIRTAEDIKAALNAGIDLTELVGEQITCAKGNRTLTWDVADYDDTLKEVTLLLHDTLPDQMVFEPAQALAYFENGLTTGDYSFISGSTTYYFTLTKAIPEGGQLKASTSTSSFTTYESQDSTTVLETGSVSSTEIAGATSIGTVANGNLNHMDRISYGSNNYAESGLRQWLNSTAPANTLMPRINKFSRPYSVGFVGFLADLDASFISCLEDTVWKCATNHVYEAPASIGFGAPKSTSYTVTDKIGLASQKEIFGSYDGTTDGSTQFDLYVGATATDRKKYYNGSVRHWWLRSPYPGHAYSERIVYTDGSVTSNYASTSNGVVPACKIRKSV